MARNTPISKMEDEIVCVDLFCGAGGLTRGLIDAGIKVVAGVDFDAACKHPYETNHDGVKFHQADVAALDASRIREWFGSATVRVLAGCAPCQPFSTYALRYHKAGKVNRRWGLLNHFARLVGELKPDIVTMENVPSVTKHPVFGRLERTLKKLGYAVWFNDDVDCSKYGLPQRRHRTVLLASLHGEIALREPSTIKASSVRDAIKGLEPIRHGGTSKKDRLHTAARLSELNYERISASRPGGTWRDWPVELVAKCHKKNTGKTYPGVYGRMEWDGPAPTLTTQFYGFGNGRFGHPSQRRGLSLREGALLQGFPKNFSFVPDDKPVQFKALGRLIGNAVPVTLGRVIGESIIGHAKQHAEDFKRRNEMQHIGRSSSAMRKRKSAVTKTANSPPTPETSRRMQRVRQKNTSPELALRRELRARGLHYRTQVVVLTKPRRTADIVFRGLRVAVFVDGCFWHGCPLHATWPKENAEFWRTKILANKERDRDTDERLRADGWKVVRVWAHELPEQAVKRIAKVIKQRKARNRA